MSLANPDDDDGNTQNHATNNSKLSNLGGNNFHGQGIPRLIFHNIRWLDHVVDPSSLVADFCEMLTVLSSMSSATLNDDGEREGGANDGISHRSNSNNKKNDNHTTFGSGNGVRGILLDGIACLPDVLGDCASLMGGYSYNNENENGDENNDNPILSTLQQLRTEDPTLLIPCLDAIGSLPLSARELERVTRDALEALATVEVWGLPALTTFLMNNCPSGNGSGSGSDSDLAFEVIEELRKLPLSRGSRNGGSSGNGDGNDKDANKTTIDTETLMIESLSRGFAHRADLTSALLKAIKGTHHSTGPHSQYNYPHSSQALIAAQQQQQQHHSPADIWLLACCATAPHNLPKVKTLFRTKANNGFFTPQLLRDALIGNGMALRSLFHPSLMELADGLLRSSNVEGSSTVELGVTLYQLLFHEFWEPMQRQEVVGSLVTHVGSGVGVKVKEVDAAMRVFSNIIDNGGIGSGKKEDGAAALRPFAPFLISLLEHLHHMTTAQVRRLFLLLFAVCGEWNDEKDDDDMAAAASAASSSFGRTGGGACDDVYIVIKKHLSLSSFAKKKIGIIGTVAYAVSRSSKLLEQQSSTDNEKNMVDTEETRLGTASTALPSPEVHDVMEMIDAAYSQCQPSGTTSSGLLISNLSSRHTISSSMGSAFSEGSAIAFLFDELCYAVRSGRLAEPIRKYLDQKFQEEFEDAFVGDFTVLKEGKTCSPTIDLSGTPDNDVSFAPADSDDLALVNGTSTNIIAPRGEIRFSIEGPHPEVYVKILSLLSSYDMIERELLPVQLCPMFRLVAALNDTRHGGCGLSELDAMLDCPMLLPHPESSKIQFKDMPSMQQWVITSSYFFATCWVRELINSFIYAGAVVPSNGSTQSSAPKSTLSHEFNATDVRKKIVARLKALVELEEELRFTCSRCFVFAAPGLDILPAPKELLDDAIPDDVEPELALGPAENALSSNGNKEVNAAAKKQASKRAKQKEKSKHKRIKAEAKHKELLCSRTMAALRPLDPQVCVALGFGELSILSNEENLSQQLSQVKCIQVGGPVTTLLLSLLENTLSNLLADNRVASFKARIGKIQNNDSSLEEESDNPYKVERSTDNPTSIFELSLASCDSSSRKCFDMLDLYLRCGVFASLFEHLAAITELRCGANRQANAEEESDLLRIARVILSCVRTLIGSTQLTRSRTGKLFLSSILSQLAEGDRNDHSFSKPPCSEKIKKMLSNLFDLVQEVLVGADTVDMDFVMDGIFCLDAIYKCSCRIDNSVTTAVECDGIPKKLSDISRRFLSQHWPEDTKLNTKNVGKLLTQVLEHSISPISSDIKAAMRTETENLGCMKTLTFVVNDVLNELPFTEKCRGPVDSFPTCCYQTFGCYYSIILQYLQRELLYLFDSSLGKARDRNAAAKTIDCVAQLANLLQTLFNLTRNNEILAKKAFLLQELKWGSRFLEIFVAKVIPFFHIHFQHHQENILDVIKLVQRCVRQLYHIISHGKREKDANLAKEAPRAKKSLEMFIHKIKSLLKKNNCMSAMTAKILKLKGINGATMQDNRDITCDDNDGVEIEEVVDEEVDVEGDDFESDDGENSAEAEATGESENEYETDDE